MRYSVASFANPKLSRVSFFQIFLLFQKRRIWFAPHQQNSIAYCCKGYSAPISRVWRTAETAEAGRPGRFPEQSIGLMIIFHILNLPRFGLLGSSSWSIVGYSAGSVGACTWHLQTLGLNIDYRCDKMRFWLSAHNCQVSTNFSKPNQLLKT
jgi:hypothetical protein